MASLPGWSCRGGVVLTPPLGTLICVPEARGSRGGAKTLAV